MKFVSHIFVISKKRGQEKLKTCQLFFPIGKWYVASRVKWYIGSRVKNHRTLHKAELNHNAIFNSSYHSIKLYFMM